MIVSSYLEALPRWRNSLHRTVVNVALTAATAILLSGAPARAGILIPLAPIPGSSSTTLEGINESSQIDGYYDTADGLSHGFIGDLNGNYISFDASPTGTLVHGLNNDGYVTGLTLQPGRTPGYAFVRHPDGSILTVTKDGEGIVGDADGIIKNNIFVGYILQITNDLYQYGYYGKGHTYRADLTLPFNTHRTLPRGIIKSGEVVGSFADLDHPEKHYYGFILKDGLATRIDYPDPDATYQHLYGLNDKETIVGAWQNEEGTAEHAFIYDFAKNRFKLIEVPGAAFVAALGINDAGLITITADGNPYVYCSKPKKECPAGALPSLEVSDRWVNGPASNLEAVACRNGCVGPWKVDLDHRFPSQRTSGAR
jgi:hypothetical protein